MNKVEQRVRNFTIKELQSCYVLFDTYWDDGLNDEATLNNIKTLLLGEKTNGDKS